MLVFHALFPCLPLSHTANSASDRAADNHQTCREWFYYIQDDMMSCKDKLKQQADVAGAPLAPAPALSSAFSADGSPHCPQECRIILKQVRGQRKTCTNGLFFICVCVCSCVCACVRATGGVGGRAMPALVTRLVKTSCASCSDRSCKQHSPPTAWRAGPQAGAAQPAPGLVTWKAAEAGRSYSMPHFVTAAPAECGTGSGCVRTM